MTATVSPTTAEQGSRLLLQSIDPAVDALTERLEAVPHLHLNLKADGRGVHRPTLSIWPAVDEDMPPALVTVHLAAEFGVPGRYIDLTPEEARIFARHLIATANLVDRETGIVA